MDADATIVIERQPHSATKGHPPFVSIDKAQQAGLDVDRIAARRLFLVFN